MRVLMGKVLSVPKGKNTCIMRDIHGLFLWCSICKYSVILGKNVNDLYDTKSTDNKRRNR